MSRRISREEFEALHGGSGMIRPDDGVQWVGQAAHPFWENYLTRATDPVANDVDLAYSRFRKEGLSHEASVQAAQKLLGRHVSQLVGRENEYNSMIARMPLEMPLPVAQKQQLELKQVMEAVQENAVPQPQRGKGGKAISDGEANERERLLGLIALAANDFHVPASSRVDQAAPSMPVVITPEVVEQLAEVEPPKSRSGMRVAMRWGLPALGGALGLYALAAVGGGGEREPVVAQ